MKLYIRKRVKNMILISSMTVASCKVGDGTAPGIRNIGLLEKS